MSKNIIEIALKAGFINTSNGLESPFIEGEDLTDNLKLFASLLLAQPEQDLDALKKDWVNFGYTAGKREQLLAQSEHIPDVGNMVEPVAWQFRTFHSEYTVCPGWDVWEDCTEPKFNNVSELITKGFYQVRKLYTSPPKREPLSESEIAVIWEDSDYDVAIVRAIEKAHGIGGGE